MTDFVGLDIGGTKTAVVLGRSAPDGGIEIVDREAFSTRAAGDPPSGRQDWREVVAHAVSAAWGLCSRRGISRGQVAGVGVSCGGPLDSASGMILSPPNLPGWDEVPIVSELERAMGCPAFLQNDANACALAEWRLGAGRGCTHMVFLTFGTGMGAGLILGGRLYEGACGLAGEVGHIRIARDGPVGHAKSGSFEGFCSGGGIAQMAKAAAAGALAAGRPPAFCRDPAALESITAEAVGDAACAGDPLAREILAESGRQLGVGLAILIDILNPERIIIGSIYRRCEPFLKPFMAEQIAREALQCCARACVVLSAGLGEKLGDYAALSVAREGVSDDHD